jgi:glycosyltransferase involved in cell wall biosynthesis
MNYLLVTHIPFARQPDGSALLDRLWAADLRGLVGGMGPVTVAAPQLPDSEQMKAWGTGFATLTQADGITFHGLPPRRHRFDPLRSFRLRQSLHQAVDAADFVHTSNLFEPDTDLYAAHDYATRTGKKTLFVVAEDFYDMLGWEWVRTAPNSRTRSTRQRALDRMNLAVRRRVANSSLTFLHTPAAVMRYRSYAANAFAIRQPVHEADDILSSEQHAAKLAEIRGGAPLRIVTASRMEALKGNDHLLRALAMLRDRGVAFNAKLYGGGRDLDMLKQLAERLKLTEPGATCVEFPGPLSPDSVLRETLAKGHVFLMPHLTNDFGRAFFDGMAAGNPVVAYRSPASQDTVRDGVDGLLAANADPESLAATLERLHRDRALLAQLSQGARIRAVSNTKTFWNQFRASLIHDLFR